MIKRIKFYLTPESKINKIMTKISNKEILTNKERRILDIYQFIRKDDLRDFLFLSKNSTFTKIKDLLEKNFTIICNLHDKDGKFGERILTIENKFEDETCSIEMEHGYQHFLHDKFLYNLIYNQDRNQFSLEEQDEYFEKIDAQNGD